MAIFLPVMSAQSKSLPKQKVIDRAFTEIGV